MDNSSSNFFASVAVFSELCNSGEELKNIIGEFVKSVFALEKKWSMDASETTILLKNHFDFDLPEAVVKTVLNKLKESGFVNKVSGTYSIIDNNYDIKSFTQKLESQKEILNQFESELVAYHEKLTGDKCSESHKKELLKSFLDYLLNNGMADIHTTVISSFIIEKSTDDSFVNKVNQIKEGSVLLNGLRYTSDFNDISKWNEELTIYLDTEHLFNAAGYNGELFKKLFDDFYTLVKEINSISLKRNQKKAINLKYFRDTQDEVEKFFGIAERIVQREENLQPNNTAMTEICKGCDDISMVIMKKTRFYEELKTKGILVQEEQDYFSKTAFNIEDKDLLEKYIGKYDEELIVSILHSFTKINYLRKGVNRTSFESCRHIIMTGKNASSVLSKDLEIKSQAKDIPFATDIDFVTNRLWFKLNKGLSKSKTPILTLDIIAKARIVLASQLNKSIDKKYENLSADPKNKNTTLQAYYYNLRERAKKPEEINAENVRESVDFIFDYDLEKFNREQSHLRHQAEEGIKAKEKLENYLRNDIRGKKRDNKKKVRALCSFSIITLNIIFIILIFASFLLTYLLISSSDTPIGIIGFILTLIVEIVGLIKYKVKIERLLRVKFKSYYCNITIAILNETH